ncbi:hypothetical protein ACWWJF_09635 [Symbiopectobacterium sp. Eva_TO]
MASISVPLQRCFGRLKEYRRIATRYDKTARNYLSMVKLISLYTSF